MGKSWSLIIALPMLLSRHNYTTLQDGVSQSVVPEPAASISPGNLLEIHIFRPQPRLIESATLSPTTSVLSSLDENHYSRRECSLQEEFSQLGPGLDSMPLGLDPLPQDAENCRKGARDEPSEVSEPQLQPQAELVWPQPFPQCLPGVVLLLQGDVFIQRGSVTLLNKIAGLGWQILTQAVTLLCMSASPNV